VFVRWWITYNLESTRWSRWMMWWVWWYDNYVTHTSKCIWYMLTSSGTIHIHNYMLYQVDGPESWEIARHICHYCRGAHIKTQITLEQANLVVHLALDKALAFNAKGRNWLWSCHSLCCTYNFLFLCGFGIGESSWLLRELLINDIKRDWNHWFKLY